MHYLSTEGPPESFRARTLALVLGYRWMPRIQRWVRVSAVSTDYPVDLRGRPTLAEVHGQGSLRASADIRLLVVFTTGERFPSPSLLPQTFVPWWENPFPFECRTELDRLGDQQLPICGKLVLDTGGDLVGEVERL